MSDLLSSMTYPFLACLLLAGIHVYLGIHVIERQVIFVDLALAQIAALGAVYGVLLGYELDSHPWAVKAFSLAFAVIGAAVFSCTRSHKSAVPHEAIIGICYAVALAATLLLTAKLPHGSEEMGQLLGGNILWVRGPLIAITAAVYAAVGLFHFLFRRQLLLISTDPQRARAEGLRLRWWDFCFYVSFGVVVTSSVAIGGVLLVFSYLVIPAVIAVLFARTIRGRLILGWIVGGAMSLVGVGVSYLADLPSGPTIVVCFAGALVLAGALNHFWRARSRRRAAFQIAAGAVALLLFAAASRYLRHEHDHAVEELLQSPIANLRLAGLDVAQQDAAHWSTIQGLVPRLSQDPEASVRIRLLEAIAARQDHSHLSVALLLLADPDDHVRESSIHCIELLADPSAARPLLDAAAREPDEFLRAELYHAVLELGDPRGIPGLLDLMDRATIPQARGDAFEYLQSHLREALDFDPDLAADENDASIAGLRSWWDEHEFDLVFDRATRRFVPETGDDR